MPEPRIVVDRDEVQPLVRNQQERRCYWRGDIDMPVTGELISETFEYDGGREVTVYVPPQPPEAIVFAGNGQLISPWGGGLEAAGVPFTMIVGAHRLGDEMLRLHEYSPGFDPERTGWPIACDGLANTATPLPQRPRWPRWREAR
jgi:hypothetical protein